MARIVTLAELLSDVQALYEIRTAALDTVIQGRWANKALALLWNHIVSVNPDMVLSSDTIAVVSGTDVYDLPTEIPDFYKGHGLDVLTENSTYSPLSLFPWEERNLYKSPCTQRSGQLYRYMGSKLYLAPAPGWSGTLRVWYIPVAPWLHSGITPSAPTTASTQATGATGITVVRVNLAAQTVYVQGKAKAIAAEADRVLHSGSVYTGVDSTTLTSGKSAIISIVAKSSSAIPGEGTISLVNVKGGTATTGSEVAPTSAQIQSVVGAGLPWVELVRVTINRTGDTTITQSQDAVENYIDLFDNWDEFITAEVAWKCAIKEADPVMKDLQGRRNQILTEVKSFAPQRDYAHNDRIRDVNLQKVSRADPFANLPYPP